MTVDLVAWTHVGRVRERNEDAVALPGVVLTGSPPHPVRVRLTERDGGWRCAVVDGMGGHRGGQQAARLAAMTVSDGPRLPLVELIQEINRTVYREMQGRPDLLAMGATIVCCEFDEQDVRIANVGDARCYVHNEGYSMLVSVDDRTPQGDRITQSVGGTSRPASVDPHVVELRRAAKMRWLLCSDGLTDTVAFSDIQHVLETPDPFEAVVSLVNRALSAGAPDNVSVIVFHDWGTTDR